MQLEVFEAALFGDEETFFGMAVAWLQRDIGFDGLLWGKGPTRTTLPWDDVRAYGRPANGVSGRAALTADPVAQCALAAPERAHALTIATACDPDSPALHFWQAWDARHLLILAKPAHDDTAVAWLGLLRATDEPFGPAQCRAMQHRAHAILTAQQLRVAKAARALAWAPTIAQAPMEALTEREMAVAQAYADGRAVKEVARLMGLSASTVQCHLSRVYRKMNVHSKMALRKVLQDRRKHARPA